jgi:uncharacterized membrane protein YeiH
MQSLWWQIFDMLGTMAFALSGTLVGVSRRMDLFGVFVLAAATAIGGGIMRDILLGHTPPVAMRSSMYFWLIFDTFFVTSFIIRYFNVRHRMFDNFKKAYLLSDAIGLGSFTVTGTLLGCMAYPESWVLDIALGVITAVGGGVIRDLLAGTVPTIFLRDIYAAASLAGASLLYSMLMMFGFSIDVSGIACFVCTVVIRIVALSLHWNLPRVRRRRDGDIL